MVAALVGRKVSLLEHVAVTTNQDHYYCYHHHQSSIFLLETTTEKKVSTKVAWYVFAERARGTLPLT